MNEPLKKPEKKNVSGYYDLSAWDAGFNSAISLYDSYHTQEINILEGKIADRKEVIEKLIGKVSKLHSEKQELELEIEELKGIADTGR